MADDKDARSDSITPKSAGASLGSSGEDVARLNRYLERFGYIDSGIHAVFDMKPTGAVAPPPNEDEFGAQTERALRKFQSMNSLPVTGVLDDATLAKMSQPRCGNPDVGEYVLSGRKWNKNHLTYAFQEFTSDLSQAEVRSAVSAAFGGGRMGAGIAQVFAIAGATVVIVERDGDAATAAHQRIQNGLAKAATLESGLDPAAVTMRITAVDDYGALAQAQLVVEAVYEDIALKRETLRRAELMVTSDTVIATNTSSLSVTSIADGMQDPSRVLGMHFFNPVPPSALVEVVVGAHTDPALPARAIGWIEALGKTPVVVQDSPGFASSRLGNALALEAIRMLEEGVATAEDIDRAMELGYRHAAGPLRTTDLIGLDVRLNVADYLADMLGDRFRAPKLLRDKVARGELGRKTGRGFYEH